MENLSKLQLGIFKSDSEKFAVDGRDLDKLSKLFESINKYKTIFVLCFSLGVTCLINALPLFFPFDETKFDSRFFIDLIFGIISLTISLCSFHLWRKDEKNLREFIDKDLRENPITEIEAKFKSIEKDIMSNDYSESIHV